MAAPGNESLHDETYLPREDAAEIIGFLSALRDRGRLAVTVAPHHLTLSTQEAADLPRISRTTLVRLLETGAIPFQARPPPQGPAR